MSNLRFNVTGSVTEVTTNYGARLGFIVERMNDYGFTIIGPGDAGGTTYTTFEAAMRYLCKPMGY